MVVHCTAIRRSGLMLLITDGTARPIAGLTVHSSICHRQSPPCVSLIPLDSRTSPQAQSRTQAHHTAPTLPAVRRTRYHHSRGGGTSSLYARTPHWKSAMADPLTSVARHQRRSIALRLHCGPLHDAWCDNLIRFAAFACIASRVLAPVLGAAACNAKTPAVPRSGRARETAGSKQCPG